MQYVYPSYHLYLRDVVQSSEWIFRYTKDLTYEDWLENEPLFYATHYHLMIVGEATSQIPDAIRDKYPDVEWRKIRAFRNTIVHRYFNVDEEIVWDLIQNKLKVLVEQVHQILASENLDDSTTTVAPNE